MSNLKTISQNSKLFNLRFLKFLVLIFLPAFLSTLLLFHFSTLVYAQCPVTDYDCQIAELQKEYDSRKDAHEKNKSDLASFNKQVADIGKKLTTISNNLKLTEKEIYKREVELGVQEELLSARLREMYKRGREFNIFLLLLSSKNLGDLDRGMALRRTAAQQDWQIITATSLKIAVLRKDKEALNKSQVSLASLKSKIGKQAQFLEEEIGKVEDFFGKIKAQQQSLLALKAAGFATSIGDVPLADDPNSRPDFNPGFSPAFAVFSFGAPHRMGMSQYGALGRAKSGQNAEQILKAYYGDVRIETREMPGSISTTIGSLPFEDRYLRGIAEMPAVWADQGGFEALKAQAIAARTYALVAGKPICVTEACQVYSRSKNDERWNRAVAETKGKVVVSNSTGKMFSTFYASTAGGYTISFSSAGHNAPGLWDTANGKDGWPNNAYEKIGGSPWFYKSWYRLRSGSKCGRNHPWLTEEEFSDIVNALLIYKGNSGAISHLSQYDTGGCSAKISDTWDKGKVKEEAAKYGGPVSKVSDVSVLYGNDGYTVKVYLETDKGRKEFSGEEFKYIFNLRASGAIGVKSGLFNLLKK